MSFEKHTRAPLKQNIRRRFPPSRALENLNGCTLESLLTSLLMSFSICFAYIARPAKITIVEANILVNAPVQFATTMSWLFVFCTSGVSPGESMCKSFLGKSLDVEENIKTRKALRINTSVP